MFDVSIGVSGRVAGDDTGAGEPIVRGHGFVAGDGSLEVVDHVFVDDKVGPVAFCLEAREAGTCSKAGVSAVACLLKVFVLTDHVWSTRVPRDLRWGRLEKRSWPAERRQHCPATSQQEVLAHLHVLYKIRTT